MASELLECPVTRKSARCQLTRPVRSFCHLSWPVLTDGTASTRTIDRSSAAVAGCGDWQIMRRMLWRANFDDARHPSSLPLKKARPGQRRHSGPRCLSPDIEALNATKLEPLRPYHEGLADWFSLAERDDAVMIAQWPEPPHRRLRQVLTWLRAQATPTVVQIVAGLLVLLVARFWGLG